MIIRDAVKADNGTLLLTKHAKDRMKERNVTRRQVLRALSYENSRMTEAPFQAPNGDWKCTIEGASAGEIIRTPIAIRVPQAGSEVIVITVIVI